MPILKSILAPLASLWVLASPAFAEMGQAFEICLDLGLTLETRGDAFVSAGWVRSDDMAIADSVLAHALLISGLAPENPQTWADSQARSVEIAKNLRQRRGYEALQLVLKESSAVVIEPNATGLATCLYAGPSTDLSEAIAVLPDMPFYHLGGRRTIRGETKSGVVIAYSMEDAALPHFPTPLDYSATFTVVLDRRDRG